MKRGICAIIVAAVAAIILGFYLHWKGGLTEALMLPPALDSSTQPVQNGYTFAAAVRPDGFDYRYQVSTDSTHPATSSVDDSDVARANKNGSVAGVWIKTPLIPYQGTRSIVRGREGGSQLFYTAERASTGELFPADWSFFANTKPQMLFIPIPGGYTDKLRWIDIIVSDQQHRVAKWRIVRLPAATQVLPTSVKTIDHVEFRGATVNARAVRWFGNGIRIDRMPQVPVAGGRQWEIDYSSPVTTWAPFTQSDASPTNWQQVMVTDPDISSTFNDRMNLLRCYYLDTPFADGDSNVRMQVRLTEFDTYGETVHFTHVPVEVTKSTFPGGDTYLVMLDREMSRTTPSGIKISLIRQGADYREGQFIRSVRVELAVSPYVGDTAPVPCSPQGQRVALPGSPIYRKYNKPVSITLQLSDGGVPLFASDTTGNSAKSGKGVYLLDVMDAYPLLPPGVPTQTNKPSFINLDVKIIQRVDIASRAFTLTLPINTPTAEDRQVNSPWNVLLK